MKKVMNTAGTGQAQTNRSYQYLLQLQSRIARYLNSKAAGWSPARLKFLLVIFCLTAGNISLYIISTAISGEKNIPPVQRMRSTIRSPVKNSTDSSHLKIHQTFNTNSNEQSNSK